MAAPGRDLLALGNAGLAALFAADTSGPCAKPDAPPPAPFGDAVLVDVSLPRSIRLMARVLFAPESAFQVAWCNRLGATGVREMPWEASATGGAGGAAVATREVQMATPPPPAWGYLVGSTPIGSRRNQTMTLAREGQAVCVEETNHLNMPFGNTFHTALQYYLAAEGPSSTRLRVTFKLVFSMRAAAMKGVLTSMVRGEHVKVFDQWSAALQEYLAGPAQGPPHGLPPLRVDGGAPGTPSAPQTPVAVLVSRAPHVAAVFGAGALAGAAAAILCAAVLHTLTDRTYATGGRYMAQLYLLRRKAESAASGHYPNAGVFLRVVGRALVYAQSQPLSLALALLLLLYAASLLLRAARLGSSRTGALGKDADGRGGAGFQRVRTPRSSASAGSGAQPAASTAAETGTNGGVDGVPGCIVHSAGPDPGSEPVATASAAAEPTAPPVVRGPIAAPDENPGVVRGVARLLSRAGRNDAAADVAEVFSLLAGDFLGRSKPAEVAAAATPEASQATADVAWALEGCDLSPEAAATAHVEEVFENSRYMPLQGWGSSYPGHLLPTDPVRRWSRLDPSQCADVLRDLVSIPPGWAWAHTWKKDMRGADVGAVDSEGWSYAVDFPFLKNPPTEGCGKESTLRCVRRRRWVRVRVPCADPPPATVVDVASPQPAVDAAEASQHTPQTAEAASVEAVEADGDRPSTPTPEPLAVDPAADGWDCDLPDLGLPADTSPPRSPGALRAEDSDDSDDSDSLTPLLERARSVLLAARGSAASPAASSALRSALVTFLETDSPDKLSPPASEPGRAASEPARPVRRELERSSFEDEGSLFDLDAGFIVHGKHGTASSMSKTVPTTLQLHARRVVTTPERCEPSPRSSLARSWTDGVRSSFEAVASGGALVD